MLGSFKTKIQIFFLKTKKNNVPITVKDSRILKIIKIISLSQSLVWKKQAIETNIESI